MKKIRKVTTFILFALLFAKMSIVYAESTNLVVNGDFETTTTNPWTGYGIDIADYYANSGSKSMCIEGNQIAEQQINNLLENTTYTLSAYVKVGTEGDTITMGVKNYGGEVTVSSTSSQYCKIETTFTTGVTNTSATIYFDRKIVGAWSWGYVDDVILIEGEEGSQTTTAPVGQQGEWELVMSDEFEGTSLNTNYWTVGWPWGNTCGHSDEIVSSENVIVNNGILELSATYSDGTWYSGLIQTDNKINQKYGYWEAKIKCVENEVGFLSAFWACTTESWPPEIDFVEVLGNDTTVAHVTQHANVNDVYSPDGFEWNAQVDLSQDYHVFGCKWNENTIDYYIDGIWIAQFENKINEPLYTLLNMHVGMEWTGDPTTTQSQSMYVDWVKIWK